MKKAFVLFGIFLILLLFISACNQQKVISIHHSALKIFDRDAAAGWGMTDFAFCVLRDDPGADFFAPLYLPHNATIKKVVAFVRDSSDSGHLKVWLLWYNIMGHNVRYIAELSTSGLPSSSEIRVLEDTTIDEPLVENDKYTYALKILFTEGASTDLSFKGAKIILE